MQQERDVMVPARHALAADRPLRAWFGREQHTRDSAAIGGARSWRAIAPLLCLLGLGCGDERPPWSGFPIFPPDAGGFELSPDLAATLLAAQAALAAQQNGFDAAAILASATSPAAPTRMTAGAPAPRTERSPRAGTGGHDPQDEVATTAGAAPDHAGAQAPPRELTPEPDMEMEMEMEPVGGDDGRGTTTVDAGTAATPATPEMPPPADAGAPATNPDAGVPDMPVPADAGTPPDAGTAPPDGGADASDADSGD